MKILAFDIETAPLVAYSWTLYPKKLDHDNIITDWSIICASWKEVGKPKIGSIAITKPGDDYKVVKGIRDALKDADCILTHNGDKFDLKKLNTRLIYHRLQPLPLIPTIDTLKEVRKIASHSSNRLDYLAKTLTGRGKIHTDFSLWKRVMQGDKKAINDMVKYNKTDVVCLEEVYEILRPYLKNHPHHGGSGCPKCGSDKVKKNGTRYTATGMKRQEWQCQTCYSYYKTKCEE